MIIDEKTAAETKFNTLTLVLVTAIKEYDVARVNHNTAVHQWEAAQHQLREAQIALAAGLTEFTDSVDKSAIIDLK